MSFVCTLILAFLAAITNWIKGVQHYPDGKFSLTPTARWLFVVIGLVTFVSWRIGEVEKDQAQENVIAIQKELAKEHNRLIDVQGKMIATQQGVAQLDAKTVANFEKDMKARIWKSYATYSVDYAYIQTQMEFVQLTIKAEAVAYARTVSLSYSKYDQEWYDQWVKSIDSLISCARYCDILLDAFKIPKKLDPDFDAQVKSALESLDKYKALLKNTKGAGYEPNLVRAITNTTRSAGETWHNIIYMILDQEYSRQLDFPTTQPVITSQPSTP